MRIASAASSASQSCVPCCVWVRHFTLSLTVLHSKLPLHIIKYAGRLLFSILIYPTPPPMHPYEIKKKTVKRNQYVYTSGHQARAINTLPLLLRGGRESRPLQNGTLFMIIKLSLVAYIPERHHQSSSSIVTRPWSSNVRRLSAPRVLSILHRHLLY